MFIDSIVIQYFSLVLYSSRRSPIYMFDFFSLIIQLPTTYAWRVIHQTITDATCVFLGAMTCQFINIL